MGGSFMASQDPPKLPLLIKLMGMTGSSNDTEALTAVRKASDLLRSAGWTWEKLLLGKITIVEDPFTRIPEPDAASRNQHAPPSRTTPASPPQPAPSYGWTTTPGQATSQGQTSAPPPSPPASNVKSTRSNSFSGHCWCCGTFVPANAGWIIKPSHFTSSRVTKWEPICDTCNHNTSRLVLPSRAPKQNASTSSLLNSI